MYIRSEHRLSARDDAFGLIESRPLGAWVCQCPDGLVANHVPFLLDRGRGTSGSLLGHVSRANDVWRAIGSGAPCVVMFSGAQAYITPNWYPGRDAHGRVVPTWNYVSVHVHGVARAIEDPAWIRDLLDRLAATHETGQPRPWAPAQAPAAYIERELRAIVGIEIAIDRIEGKLKASQDEAMADRLGTVRGLRAAHGDESHALAELVARAIADDTTQEG